MSAQAPASRVRSARARTPEKMCGNSPWLTWRSADASDMNNALAQAERLWANLLALGAKRLMALLAIGVIVFAATGIAGYFLSRPSTEVLYYGLDRDDVVSIGSALREVGIPFD